jgi:dihydroorotase (multifunctional complex type)
LHQRPPIACSYIKYKLPIGLGVREIVETDLAIVGGTVVTGSSVTRADVLVREGRIAGVLPEGAETDAERIVDAGGLLVMPGMVDTHVHLMDPGSTEREDFPTGTAAAAARGVTTLVEHTHAHPVRNRKELLDKVAYLRGRSNVCFGLAAHVWPDRIAEMEDSWRAGVTFFKIFTCATHGVPGIEGNDLRRVFRLVAGFGGTCLVHAEDETLTAGAERALRAAGRTDPGVITEWRSAAAELEAVRGVTDLAVETAVRLTIAHVSSPPVAETIAAARRRGADVAAEGCPQYLLLEENGLAAHGALRKFTPPARNRSTDDADAMWRLLADGVLTHVATDHAPSTIAQKLAGDIWEAPFGLPGLDTTTRLLLDAVAVGRLSWSDVVRCYAEEPAKRYGLWPAKGRLAEGADADLILVDPAAIVEIRDEDVISKAGWTPFAGRTTRGDVVRVFLGGEEIARGGVPRDERTGWFLPGPGLADPKGEPE